MTAQDTRATDEAAIRALIDAVAAAVRAKDIEKLLSHCASDITIFDMLPPLEHKGHDGIRQLWARALTAFEPPLVFDVDRLAVMVGGDVALSRSLDRVGGTRTDGQRMVCWLCSTLGFRKIDGRWKIAHQHNSVPIDGATGKAMLDLKP